MREIGLYVAIGYATELLSQSKYHKKYPVYNYIMIEILPALKNMQLRFYTDEIGRPIAMISWAWISTEVETDIHKSGRSLQHYEWKCGDKLFINDWIAPYGNTNTIIKDISENVFHTKSATSIRRNQDGTVRKINHWKKSGLRGRAE